jgi:DNA gyrase subunit A
MLPLQEFAADHYVFLATENGTVKKTGLDAFEKIRVTGIKAINLDEGDRLVAVAITSEKNDVLLVSANGLSVRFREDQVRPMGREARGVRGMDLREGDKLVGMVTFERDSTDTLMTVSQRGYGKRTNLGDYPVKNRGGKGVITIKTSARNGKVSAIRVVAEDHHLILISDKGKLIRIRVKDVPIQGRATQGVRVMRLEDGEMVAAIERLVDPEEATDIAEGSPVEAADEGDTERVEAEGAEGEESEAEDEAPADDDAEGGDEPPPDDEAS